jgi:anti-sigma factor ChrR (cupin superfamily)
MTERSDSALAAGLALGTLDAETLAKARIRAIEDPDFAAEAAAWERLLAPLALSGEATPPAGLLETIEARIAALGSELPGTITRRAGAGEWIEAGPGLRLKLLNRIESLNRRTILAHLQPGAEYLEHGHSQDEEIYMIEGDLIIGELVLGPGDFHLAQAGRRHPVHRSNTGCLCIISQAVD